LRRSQRQSVLDARTVYTIEKKEMRTTMLDEVYEEALESTAARLKSKPEESAHCCKEKPVAFPFLQWSYLCPHNQKLTTLVGALHRIHSLLPNAFHTWFVAAATYFSGRLSPAYLSCFLSLPA
ncbi:hypothetical protein CYMTET_43319, partial [Cymbomonas tetramitiformis]